MQADRDSHRDDRFAAVGVKGWAPQATLYCIGWNMDGSNPFFGDKRVRRAMSLAINRQGVVDNILMGSAALAAAGERLRAGPRQRRGKVRPKR